MIANDYTNETVHAANWLLYSGYFDWADACERASNDAPKDDLDAFEEEMIDKLESIVEEAFLDAINEAIPEAGVSDVEFEWIVGRSEENYRNMTSAEFALTLLADTVSEISFRRVAEIILKHRVSAIALPGLSKGAA